MLRRVISRTVMDAIIALHRDAQLYSGNESWQYLFGSLSHGLSLAIGEWHQFFAT
jgi:hypothetical protein